MLADLVVSFKVFREKFGSRVTLWPGKKRIDTEYIEGPFKHLHSRWEFRDVEGGSEVHFEVDFEFRNIILQKARRACSSSKPCSASSAPLRAARTSFTGSPPDATECVPACVASATRFRRRAWK